MSSFLVLENLSVSFGGVPVISHLSCEFEQGFIHGIFGRNGSGKTVLFKLICGFLPADTGRILIGGVPMRSFTSQNIGIILEEPGFLDQYSARDNLRYLAGIKKKINNQDIDGVLISVGLNPSSKKPVKQYSLGMKHRLAIAQAIMEKPPLLLLDEPMNGLDNQGVSEIKGLLRHLRDSGCTILVTSHYLEDLTDLSDKLWKMDGGTLSH